jgi:small-conductance mechanosensitive channel
VAFLSVQRRWQPLGLCALLFLSPAAGAFNAGLGEVAGEVDRSSPLATTEGFLSEAHAGHLARAAHYLWLDDVPVEQRARVGEKLARRLRLVLEERPVDFSTLSKDGESGAGSVLLTVADLEGKPTPIRLVRLRSGDSVDWLFSRDTVRALAALDAGYDPPFAERMPRFLFDSALGLELWQWLGLLLGLLAAFLGGWLGQKLVLAALERLLSSSWGKHLVSALLGPLTVLVALAILQPLLSRLLLPPRWAQATGLLCSSLGIVAAAWLLLRALEVAETAINKRLDARGTGAARGARTQVAVLWRVLAALVCVLALAALLMQFTLVRTVGVSLLASAGVAGIVLGFAAQKSIGAFISGIQLSLSQPIRIGDSVVVEGESGTVVKISLTHVTLSLFDNRQLIVPVTYFLEKPFQNWTLEEQDLLGAVVFQLDFRVDVDALRTELARILAGPAKGLWNGRISQVQVTDASGQTATVRILASASAGALFDLRCLLREEFLKFLRQHPAWLPTHRLEQHLGEAD